LLKRHNIEQENFSNFKKIERNQSKKVGTYTDLLLNDIYKEGITLTEKKKTLNELCGKGN